MSPLDAVMQFAGHSDLVGLRMRSAALAVPAFGDRLRALLARMSVAMLVILLAVALWLLWVLANRMLGEADGVFALAVLLGGAAALSRYSSLHFAGALIVAGFGGLTLSIVALFGMAGYALLFGG
jgi:hypothetical protein